jgi:acyl-CoA reductase-like NAD-dependent aldehyde dehydrogenase
MALWPIPEALAAAPSCAGIFRSSVPVAAATSGVIRDKKKYFADLLWLIENSGMELRRELRGINNELGSDIELAQVKAFLRGLGRFEMNSIENIEPVDNAVIYGSTNVPLYTLVAQVFLVGSFSRNVWVRTPEATRDVYLRIFGLFRSYLPSEYTRHIHLITDPSELSYDSFNRVYVMGLSRSGKQVLRPPSELVILTGNPDTARGMIDRNIRNLQRVAVDNPGRKQLFLGFLAGVNPAVVLPSAREQVQQVVDKLVFPFLVNAGQDCMNSDLVFVHSAVAPEFLRALGKKFSSLKMTNNEDLEKGITPVTMAKSFDRLLAYKEKYKKYLVTPMAKIDVTSRKVEPHVFVIPFSEFSHLEIHEHFAPFMTIVKYSSLDQLRTVSLDPRIQKKSMMALLFGGNRMAHDLQEARDVFRESQHAVVTNSHLYNEFDMNMPFGGVGTDSSMSVLVEIAERGEMRIQNRNRPLLISRETELAFPKLGRQDKFDLTLNKVGQSVPQSSSLKEAREVAQREGLFMVGTTALIPSALRQAEALYGIKIVTPRDGRSKQRHKGVALHRKSIADFLTTSLISGKIDLLTDDPAVLTKFNSKAEELSLVRSIDPSLMPATKTFTDLEVHLRKLNFESRRRRLLDLLNQAELPGTARDTRDLEISLDLLVGDVLEVIRLQFPQGAYIKNYGEFASGDYGNAITTFNTSSLQTAREFVLWATEIRKKHPNRRLEDPWVIEHLRTRLSANGARFVLQLLLKPQVLLAQERLELLQTQSGQPMEFRVDFIKGEAVGVRMRYGYEYAPAEAEMAKQVLMDFLQKTPPEVRHLSGGADVGFLKNGKAVIFEFNFGGASGTLYPEYYPFEANQIFSYLKGSPTPLLRMAHELLASPIQDQRDFIKSRRNEKPLWWKNMTEDISQLEWARWLRDQHLEKWRKSRLRDVEATEKLREDLKILLLDQGTSGNLDFRRLYEAADQFLRNPR